MSVAPREFVFCVNTDEVATTMAPPAPVIAQPRRRASAPTVALRLPHLTATPAAEQAIPSSPAFTPWVAPDMAFAPSAKPEAPSAPVPAVSIPMAAPAAAPPPIAVVEAPPIQQPAPATLESVRGPSTVAEAPQAGLEQEPLWKNPKFMLAGVAAAFLGMVSLIAVKHEPDKLTDDAPRWPGTNSAHAPTEEISNSTPVVVRGEESAAPNWAGPAVPEASAQHNHSTAPSETHGAAPTTLFADRRAATEPYAPPAQSGWGAEATAHADDDDMETGVKLGAPLPNLQMGGAYEASHADPGYQNTTR